MAESQQTENVQDGAGNPASAEQLMEQVRQLEEEQKQIKGQLAEAQREQELLRQLTRAGAADVDVALLLARERLAGGKADAAEVKRVIGELRRERPGLFGEGGSAETWPGPTAGVRGRAGAGGRALNHLAQRASRSGSRQDMQEYLRARRTMKR